LFLVNIELWSDLLEEEVNKLDGKQYGDFLSSLINKSRMIIKDEIGLPDITVEVLMNTSSKINEIPKNKKIEIIEILLDLLNRELNILDWQARFVQNLICSIKYEDLESIIKASKTDFKESGINEYTKRLNSLLRSIEEDNLPYDNEILDIIDFGTPRMVNTLVSLIRKNSRKLLERNSTLMLLFESDMGIIIFNLTHFILHYYFQTFVQIFEYYLSMLFKPIIMSSI